VFDFIGKLGLLNNLILMLLDYAQGGQQANGAN
jgi:hypothetical protein